LSPGKKAQRLIEKKEVIQRTDIFLGIGRRVTREGNCGGGGGIRRR